MRKNRTVKALLFTLMMAFFAVGTIAIAKEVMKNEEPVKVEKTVVMQTWYFKGGDPNLPSNYSDDPAEGQPCIAPLQTICTIQAPANGDQPNFSESVDGKTIGQHVEDAVQSLSTSSPLPLNNVVTGYRAN